MAQQNRYDHWISGRIQEEIGTKSIGDSKQSSCHQRTDEQIKGNQYYKIVVFVKQTREGFPHLLFRTFVFPSFIGCTVFHKSIIVIKPECHIFAAQSKLLAFFYEMCFYSHSSKSHRLQLTAHHKVPAQGSSSAPPPPDHVFYVSWCACDDVTLDARSASCRL